MLPYLKHSTLQEKPSSSSMLTLSMPSLDPHHRCSLLRHCYQAIGKFLQWRADVAKRHPHEPGASEDGDLASICPMELQLLRHGSWADPHQGGGKHVDVFYRSSLAFSNWRMGLEIHRVWSTLVLERVAVNEDLTCQLLKLMRWL